MKFLSTSVAETEKIAQDFVQQLPKKKGSEAYVIGLSGDLGSGKTTFMQCFAKSLGVTESITSPTYVIEKVYEINRTPFKKLIHIDAYRLKSGGELAALGFAELVKDQTNLICIEWPERVKDILPAEHREIHFTFVSENERQIEL